MGDSYSHITSAGFCRCLAVTVSPCLMHIPAGRMKSPGMGKMEMMEGKEEEEEEEGEEGSGTDGDSGTGSLGAAGTKP